MGAGKNGRRRGYTVLKTIKLITMKPRIKATHFLEIYTCKGDHASLGLMYNTSGPFRINKLNYFLDLTDSCPSFKTIAVFKIVEHPINQSTNKYYKHEIKRI